MRFGHTGDCHLGGWSQPEMAELTMQSFTFFIDTCIKERLDFVVIAGDFFDSAYPRIEAIKHAFDQLRRLKEAHIPAFIIAGSHDYSASGKSFIDVLEKGGFVKNAFQPEERDGTIYLSPIIHQGVALYGYPGKRSGLEVEDIKRIKLHEAPGLYRILMLHTALRDALGNLPIPAVDHDKLPKVDYIALAHLHVKYEKPGRVYSGPLFPNNVMELEELGGGSFYIVDTKGKIERREVKLKDVKIIETEIRENMNVMETMYQTIEKLDIRDSIVILKFKGHIEGKQGADIKFAEIESLARKKGAYAVLKNTSQLYGIETRLVLDTSTEEVEENVISTFKKENKSPFNETITNLLHVFNLEKKEEEKAALFEERLFEEFKKNIKV